MEIEQGVFNIVNQLEWERFCGVTFCKIKRSFANANGIKIASGASKFCLIFPDKDFVIKIPAHFTIGDKDKNYCADEVKFYNSSINARVQKLLPETHFYCFTDNGIPIYWQQRVDYNLYTVPKNKITKIAKATAKITEDLMLRVRKSYKIDDRRLDILWLKMVWLLYGEKFTRSLIKWLNDNRINDLHGENIGYTAKGKPMLIDFCGYHD